MSSGHLFCLTMTLLYSVYDSRESVDRNVHIHDVWKTIVCEAVFTHLDCIICTVCGMSQLAVAFWEVCMENVIFCSLTLLIHTLMCVR